jgi:iron complex outermembrane receptor protein
MLTGKSEGPTEVTGDVLYGSYKTHRESVSVTGGNKDFDYQLSTSNFASDGYRQQSKNDKKQATAKLGVKISDDTQLTTLLNWFEQYAQDPGGLVLKTVSSTKSYLTNPETASLGAIGANSRSERKNTQVGFNLEKRINLENSLNVILYAGHRDNLGFLAKPNPPDYNPGSLSAISRDFYGTELKWANKGQFLSMSYNLVAGFNYGNMADARTEQSTSKGEINSTTLTRDEKQTATNMDEYIQGSLALNDKLDIHGGLRYTKLDLDINNKLTPFNKDEFNFEKIIPVIGTTYKVTPTFNLYANMGQGFETPTLIEVTYSQIDGTGGPNTSLKSSTSTNYEIGSKWIAADNTTVNAAVFMVNAKDEIIVDSVGDKTVYRNYAGTTKRTGLELGVASDLGKGFNASLAYTYLDATFDDTFNYTPKSGTQVTVTKGSQIPGTYKQQAFAELAWSYPAFGFQTAVNVIHNSSVEVNDANQAGTAAAAFTVFNIRSSLNQKIGAWNTTEYIALNNFTDVKYVGSVRVNDYTNLRYYEPAAPFNWIVGVKAAYKF